MNRFSAELGFRAITQGACELLWIRLLLKDLRFDFTDSMRLYRDNKSATNVADNPLQHDRTKHVEIDIHFIKENITSGTICTTFVKTCDQLADVLTKSVGSRQFHFVLSKRGLRDIFVPA